MAAVCGWVKNIVVFYILIMAVLHMLPKGSYRKYIRFFCGMLMAVYLLTPVLEFLYHPDYLLEKISYESFWQDMDTLKLDTAQMEDTQREAFLREYERAIAADIVSMAEDQGLEAVTAQVRLSEEYTVESIELTGEIPGREGILVDPVSMEDYTQDYPQVQAVKEKIQKLYEIGEEQLDVRIQFSHGLERMP